MKFKNRFFLLLFLGSLLYATCTDPTTIGADLFEEDIADINFTDTLTLKVSTVTGDSALVYRASSFTQLPTYLFGNMIDPIFGQSAASIYLQSRLESIEPDFEQAVADSIVLVLPYDTAFFYGNTGDLFEMEVLQLDEPFMENTDYYSSQDLMTKPAPIGSGSFRPSPDSVVITTFASDGDAELVKVPGQLRLKLDISLAQDFLDQPAETYASDTSFLNYFYGLYLKPIVGTSGMISFNPNNSNAGIFLYYKNAEGSPRQFQFEVGPGSILYERFEHDYTGSPVEPFINEETADGEVAFVQGMTGVGTRIEIPYIDDLKGMAVNKAELEVYVKTLDNDAPASYPPLDDLILTYNNNGNLALVRDLAIADDPVSPLTKQGNFGGVLTPGENGQPSVYRMNISAHLQDIINGTRPNVIYLAAYRRTQHAGRVAIYGPKDPIYGLKINVAFTNL